MRPPYSSGVQRLLRNAQHYSGKYHHRFVHTEYVLLALLKDSNGATQLLREMGRDINALRRKCEAKCHRGEHPMEAERKLTPRVQHVMALAHEQMKQLGHSAVDTRHVLIGLAIEDEGVAGELLRKEGLTADGITAALKASAAGSGTPHQEEVGGGRASLWKRLLGR
jgi:ATP-dependent Clp protease ATP-binding subunit ClpC